jgi:hypothetical protein
LKKLKKNTQVEIPKSERINQNAMRVFIKAAGKKKITDEEEKEERKIESVPHKQSKAEALKKKKKTVVKSKKASVTSMEFLNKKFQKLLDFYKIPCILQKVISLCVDIKQTLKYLEKQLEFYDMLKDFQIARLPKYFRPYAEVHFKKEFDGKLPIDVMANPKHMFHLCHKFGCQKGYTSSYEAHFY